ncbi:MAG: complex I subunit 5 family protein [Candidatus Njordarchaeia archaeon]
MWPMELYAIYEPIIIPVFAAIIIAIISQSKRIISKNKLLGGITFILFGLTLIEAFRVFLRVYNYDDVVTYWFAFKSPNAACLEIDIFSAIMMILFTLIGVAVALYSMSYMDGKPALPSYYILLALMVAALNGVASAGDFFTFFIFYELLGITAYTLVAYFKNKEAIEAAIKYILMDATGSTLVLMGFAMLYGLTGTLNIAVSVEALRNVENISKWIVLVILFSGFSFKAAIFPMHSWLIDAHPAAPSGISAMLSGVVIKSGFYAIVRTFILMAPVTGEIYNYILIIAILTMTIPNIIALVQTDIKRILAYSSIYNMGVVIAGISVATPLGVTAGIFHAINHALLKALMFMAAGVFVHAAGKRNLEDLKGIGRKMPITAFFFGFGAIALMGLPPLNIFYSKFLIAWAALQVGGYTGVAIALIILINSIISIGYYGKLIRYIIMKEAPEGKYEEDEESGLMVLGMTIIFLAVIIICMNPNFVIIPVQAAVKQLFNPFKYIYIL